MIIPGSVLWFARHELRLAWRDAVTMLQGGRRRNAAWAIVVLLVTTIVLHLIAYAALRPSVADLLHPGKVTLVTATGSAFLAWTLSLSQAMETATRVFYARADLDLILSSPASARRLFAVRIGGIAVSAFVMSALVIGPFVDVMAMLGGAQFLLAYGVIGATACSAAAVAVCLTALLFRLFGPKRTRLAAQVVAGLVGAGFVIGVQGAAIMSSGSLSRTALFQSAQWVAAAPDLASPIWWPARAGMGDPHALAAILVMAVSALAATMAWGALVYSRNAHIAAGLPSAATRPGRAVRFGGRSPSQTLRAKEWMLLWRDPWLVSQSLTQILYLLPPALLLWRDFGAGMGHLAVLVPVLVMAAGQLGGGLAWLALSGEDAPDLVTTAPVAPSSILRAKIEAVMLAVALPIAPFVLALACVSPFAAAVTVIGTGLAAAGATSIQLVFKTQAKRTNFRRRQTSSRLATFAEALVSISVAGASGLAAAGLWLAVVPMAVAAGVVLGSRAIVANDGGA